MKKTLVLCLAILIYFSAISQPANDDICSAITLTVLEGMDPCIPSPTATTGVTSGGVTLPAGGCGFPSVDTWYKFNSPGDAVFLYFSFQGSLGSLVLGCEVFTASACNSTLTRIFCTTSAHPDESVQIPSVVPGITYYVRIFNSSLPASIGLCAYTASPATAVRIGINTNAPQANVDVAGNTIFRNSINFKGNLGINVPSPVFPLNFSSTLGDKISLYGNTAVAEHYGFGIQNGVLQIHSDLSTSDIVFGYGSSASFTERIRIKGNGNLGLGTSNPVKPLSFPPSLGEKILLYPGGAGEVGIGVYGNELRLHADNPGAKVSFGTQDNAGTFSENALAQRNGVYAFSVLGSLWVNGTTYASDERFKQNIHPISSPIQKLIQLKGVEYELRTKEFPQYHFTAGRQMGLLAQNVETVVPEAVNEKDGFKGVDYARLVPLLIEAMKEQNKKIEALEEAVRLLTK